MIESEKLTYNFTGSTVKTLAAEVRYLKVSSMGRFINFQRETGSLSDCSSNCDKVKITIR